MSQIAPTDVSELAEKIEHWFEAGPAAVGNADALAAFHELRERLEAGEVRSAQPDKGSATGWQTNAWVKRGILLGFRLGSLISFEEGRYTDKHTLPARRFTAESQVRVIPGGSAVRAGAYMAKGVIMVPPAYVNIGAYVDEGAMIDSHALVGSCAQIGKRVHLSAAAQIGGVLEPISASPVIIEDDVLVGGNTGVYEGTIVRRGAVLAAGTILTRGTPVYDLVTGAIHRAMPETVEGPARPLVIPAEAVVVPGSRAVRAGRGVEWGISVATPVIVKYRDEKTNLSATLEELLR